jgi:hypothetical protein
MRRAFCQGIITAVREKGYLSIEACIGSDRGKETRKGNGERMSKRTWELLEMLYAAAAAAVVDDGKETAGRMPGNLYQGQLV